MKRSIAIIWVSIMLLSLISCAQKSKTDGSPSPATPSEASIDSAAVIEFSDLALEAKVREALNKSEGVITVGDALSLKKLDISNPYPNTDNRVLIRDISALKYFTNLGELLMGGNEISDLRPIAGLINIMSLGIGDCLATDLSPLSGMTQMKVLTMSRGNQLENLNALSAMTSLEQLEAKEIGLTDISALAKLTSIWELQLSGNRITDISPLSGLTGLKTLLLSGNQISDYHPLKEIYPELTIYDFEID